MNTNKHSVVVLFLLVIIYAGVNAASDINTKIAQLDVNTADISDIIKIFGEPQNYVWGNETFQREKLPPVYLAVYPDGFSIAMNNDRIIELRFTQPNYTFHNKLKVGSLLDEVLQLVGEPAEIVINQQLQGKDNVLYKDIDGRKGYCYYSLNNQNVRFFFSDYRISALYITTNQTQPHQTVTTNNAVQKLYSVKMFDDVRGADLSGINLSGKGNIIRTLTFNNDTIWPPSNKMPTNISPKEIMQTAMNPGLGVHQLHKQGITGKGVSVAIIDQAMTTNHHEYASKIIAYHNLTDRHLSMHGPAVTSLLVGTNCGTAPDAKVYYCATRDGCFEIDYAKSLLWIIEQNKSLPDSEKIRVVSVSAMPGSAGTLSAQGEEKWDDARECAERNGIMVLDCTRPRGFINKCWYNLNNPDSFPQCTPGYHLGDSGFSPDEILTPASVRTTAEERTEGIFTYIYWGRGGLSWTNPYCAGVLAMGWQIRPELTPQQMKELLFKSAYVKNNAKIINPARFIQMVKDYKN